MKKLIFLVFAALLSGCEEAPVATPFSPTARRLVGQWRNKSMRIKMNTYRNTDSSFVFEVAEKNWEEKMRIHPIRTFFKADGTYSAQHINLEDSIIFNPAGIWLVSGDSLFLRDTFPSKGPVYKYKLEVKNNMAQFWGLEDADGDGQRDDEYYGLQWRHYGHEDVPDTAKTGQ